MKKLLGLAVVVVLLGCSRETPDYLKRQYATELNLSVVKEELSETRKELTETRKDLGDRLDRIHLLLAGQEVNKTRTEKLGDCRRSP